MSAPAVAVSRDGKKTTIAWMMEQKDGNQDVLWTPGGAESMVTAKDDGDQNHPTLAIDDKGVSYTVWEDLRGGKPRAWGRTSEKNAKDEPISSDDDGDVGYPVVATGGGLTVVVYEAGKDNVLLRVWRDAK